MIRGAVDSNSEAVVRLRLRGPTGVEADVDAVVDTGFPSSLTLSPAVVTALGLVRQSGGTAMLANGSPHPYDQYAVEVEWGGTWRPVLAWMVGDYILLGMGLLTGHQLRIEAVPGGAVEITPYP
jgi:predicted aspartyl protease